MPTRPRKPTDLPEPERPGQDDEEEPIEILEVVGVDETTGAAVKGKAGREQPASHRGKTRQPPEDSVKTRELEEALRDKDKYYDLLLRKQAEFDNFRKRMERERDESGTLAVRDVVKHMLPVLDNMERALRASEGSRDPLFKGIELVHQQFLDLLRKQGVVPIEALGARFDPRQHEAVEVRDVPGLADVVIEEMQKGYMHNDRLLRPALVKVASGKGAADSAPDPGRERGDGSGTEEDS